MSLLSSFSFAARTLAFSSLDHLFVPGRWRKATHKFNEHLQAFDAQLYRSDTGAYGVSVSRWPHDMASELFISRVSYLLRTPTAPTFIHKIEKNGLVHIMSIVPFDTFISSPIIPDRHGAFLEHYSKMLPFLLWLGNDTDRAESNMIAHTENGHFVEFDFNLGDMTNVFTAAITSGGELAKVKKDVEFIAGQDPMAVIDDRPILRSAFMRTFETLKHHQDMIINQATTQFAPVMGLKEGHFDIIKHYTRQRLWMIERCLPKLEDRFVDRLPRAKKTITGQRFLLLK